jgi:uncharacterized protein (TIGR02266 family)
MSEQRKHERAPLRLQLNYRDVRGESFLFESSTNISKGGIFIETDAPLPVGTHLVIRFDVPGRKRTVEAEGDVKWVNSRSSPNPGMGVAWKKLTEKQHDDIAHVVGTIAILPD